MTAGETTWLKEGRSPVKPHELVATFGTMPARAWDAEPPGRGAAIEKVIDNGYDVTTEGILKEQKDGVLNVITVGTQAFASTPCVGEATEQGWNEAAPTWPRPETRTAYAATVWVSLAILP